MYLFSPPKAFRFLEGLLVIARSFDGSNSHFRAIRNSQSAIGFALCLNQRPDVGSKTSVARSSRLSCSALHAPCCLLNSQFEIRNCLSSLPLPLCSLLLAPCSPALPLPLFYPMAKNAYLAATYSAVYTMEEFANIFKLSRQSLRSLIRTGEIPAIRIGKQHRIPQIVVDHYFALATSPQERVFDM